MYSLNCEYYTKEFDSIESLLQDAVISGIDPWYEITYNGKGIGEKLLELLVF